MINPQSWVTESGSPSKSSKPGSASEKIWAQLVNSEALLVSLFQHMYTVFLFVFWSLTQGLLMLQPDLGLKLEIRLGVQRGCHGRSASLPDYWTHSWKMVPWKNGHLLKTCRPKRTSVSRSTDSANGLGASSQFGVGCFFFQHLTPLNPPRFGIQKHSISPARSLCPTVVNQSIKI